METDLQIAPSVVSVMVVHEPGPWFGETLEALAAQDYSNLRTLFLITPTSDQRLVQVTEQIRSVLPGAFVREAPSNNGFGQVANEVLRLVQGENGFFLICHDDIAPAPNAVRTMVAELFRSNAGIVGPKLTEWYDGHMLQHVGLGLDRFGEVDALVEPGEADQEQHDAVRDVFVVPSACMLVRADLFRTLGGFDPAISFYGEDVELCWRAHHTGARVIVAPDASVRHLEHLSDRRPDLPHRTLQSRHRMRTVATLTGGSRLLGRSIQMVLLTLVELVVGLFTGRLGEAFASLRALGGLIPRTGSLIARRRAILGQRVVPEREVIGLQNRGSARLTSYLRGRETATFVGEDTTVRRWRQASFGPLLAWFLVILAIVIGSRSFIRDGVPTVGEFLPFPASPGDLWGDYRSSFNPTGFGATAPAPTGWAVLAVTSVVGLFRMPLFMTMSVVGLYLLGALGAWHLAGLFPVGRARIAAMIIYVGTPLVPGLMQTGDWSALAWFAAFPWLVHQLTRVAGLAAADPGAAESDLTDGVANVGWRHRAKALAIGSVILAMAAAFAPVVVVLWLVAGALLAVATLIAGSSWRVAAWLGGAAVVSALVAYILNLPWALEWTWADLAGPQRLGGTGRSLSEIATLAPNQERFMVLGLLLYLPTIAAVTISRAWRFTWSVRASALVLTFGAGILMSERGSFDIALPATSMLAVPVALGLALGGAAITGGFGFDVLGRGFGWRQPAALVANAAIVVGLIPAVISIGDGAWHVPSSPLPRLAATQFGVDQAVGDYRVLYVGDERVLPVPGRSIADGLGYAVVDGGPLDFKERFLTPHTAGDDAIERVLDLVAAGSTLRAGRLLAPLGIRYIVVPVTDGSTSTLDHPLAIPAGLVEAMQTQLDIGVLSGPPSLKIFTNQAWLPVGAQLFGDTAAASKLAGEDALARADLSNAVPSMLGIDAAIEAANEVAPGAVHLAIPFDDRFVLTVDGSEIVARPSFGVSTAFDVAADGVGVVSYERDSTRSVWLTAQLLIWLAVLVIAAGVRSPFGRRRSAATHDETLIDLSDDATLSTQISTGIAGEALVASGFADEVEFSEFEAGESSDYGFGATMPTVGGDGAQTLSIDDDRVGDEEPDRP